MGKLVEKLQQVGQATGSRFGFTGRAETAARKPRPAAVFVSLHTGDSAIAEATAKAGADGILIDDWVPGTDVGRMKAALEPSGTLWGVEYAAGALANADGAQKAAASIGAGFMVVGPSAPAAVLFDEVEQFDLVVRVDAPKDDLALLLLRAENLLPAQAALIGLPSDPAVLGNMRVSDFARLRLVFETIRFPALVMLSEAPQADTVKALVHLGVGGIILSGAGGKSEVLTKQVQTLCEVLQTIPVQESRRSPVAIGGFMTSVGESPVPRRPGQPSPEPDEE